MATGSAWRTRTSWNRPSFSRAQILLRAPCSLSMRACRRLSSHPCRSIRADRGSGYPGDRQQLHGHRYLRLARLPAACPVKTHPVSWRALKQQFGISFSRLDNFKATLLQFEAGDGRLSRCKDRGRPRGLDPASVQAACGAEADSSVLLNPNFCSPPHRVAPASIDVIIV